MAASSACSAEGRNLGAMQPRLSNILKGLKSKIRDGSDDKSNRDDGRTARRPQRE